MGVPDQQTQDGPGQNPGGGKRDRKRKDRPVNNAEYVYQWLVRAGYSQAGAAGIVGNLSQESGLNPHSVQQGGPGRGLAQWSEGARWANLQGWANKQNMDPWAMDTQLAFLVHELAGMPELDQMLRQTKDAAGAASQFMHVFEVPDPAYANEGGRAAAAQAAFQGHFRQVASAANYGNTGGYTYDGGGGGGGGAGGGGDSMYARQQRNAERDRKATNYGYVDAFLKDHPEVAALVDQAEKEHWTEARLAYEIKDTDWWKNHDRAQRQWALLVAEQPKDAEAAIADARKTLQQMAGQAGVPLSGRELSDLAEKAARNQWSQAELQFAIGRKFDMPGRGDALVGAAGSADTMLTQMAADYGVSIDKSTRERWVRRSLEGTLDPQTMTDYFREQAKILYPSAKALLDQNHSLRDILTPYLSVAANELGIPADQIQLTDPKWTKPLTGPNGMMNIDEWTTAYRTDKRYGWDNSPGGRAAGADITNGLMQMFGQGF